MALVDDEAISNKIVSWCIFLASLLFMVGCGFLGYVVVSKLF